MLENKYVRKRFVAQSVEGRASHFGPALHPRVVECGPWQNDAAVPGARGRKGNSGGAAGHSGAAASG